MLDLNCISYHMVLIRYDSVVSVAANPFHCLRLIYNFYFYFYFFVIRWQFCVLMFLFIEKHEDCLFIEKPA